MLWLAMQMHARIAAPRFGVVYVAPVDVHLAPGTLVQPDVIAVETARVGIVGRKKITGVPTLLIEVLSPSAPGRRRDRKLVRDRYERAGVAEYLIVDPQARSMEQFVLRGGRYGAAVLCRATLALASFPGVAIDLRAIW